MRNAQQAGRALALLATTLLLTSSPAHAVFRAYVASDGLDTNPCTLPQPCRLLPAALTVVDSGGEIWMLDSANYNTGPVNVTKSVTILAIPGALGSVVALGGDAIVIATPGVKVALRNLVIVPFPGGGLNGVNMTNGAALTVEGCLFANLPQAAIFVDTAASVRITDTTLRDSQHGLRVRGGARAAVTRANIGGNTFLGVLVEGLVASTTTSVDIGDSTIDGNNIGVNAISTVASSVAKVTVRDSRVFRNNSFGLIASSAAGAAVTLAASNNVVSNNDVGIRAEGAGARVWATGNTVSDNAVGLSNDLALFETASNNAVRNNNVATNGAITIVPTM